MNRNPFIPAICVLSMLFVNIISLNAQNLNRVSANGLFDEYWHIGINAGTSHYIGDLNNNNSWAKCTDMSIGGIIGHQVSPVIGFRFQYINGNLSASCDNNFGKSVKTDFWDFGYNATLNINELIGNYNPKRFLNLYLMAGPSLVSYHSVVLNNDEMPYMETKDRTNEMFLMMGAGASIRILRSIDFNVEGSFHYSSCDDRMDFVDQQSKNDRYRYVSAGLTYKLLPRDKDMDGVADKHDPCPDLAGSPFVNGCVDSDADGIPDKDDACPGIAGKLEFKGCPDTDGDGISDKDDLCQAIAGKKELNGCPDADGDGVADNDDQCPDIPGTAKTNGCPDKDSDGVADKDDRCPDTKGDAEMQGCPDRDSDGTPDIDDQCPDVSGLFTNNGCPGLNTVELSKILYFDIQKTAIKSTHTTDLDAVVSYLKQNPKAGVLIQGHADAVGDEDYNMQVSDIRAQNVADYISSKGIAPNRISSESFGESKPAGTNKTKEGRRVNRRVVVEVK